MAFSYYEYVPSKAAAVIACLVFIIITLLHSWQLFRTRTWFFIPFVIGGLCMCKMDHSNFLEANILRQSKSLDMAPEPTLQANILTTP